MAKHDSGEEGIYEGEGDGEEVRPLHESSHDRLNIVLSWGTNNILFKDSQLK